MSFLRAIVATFIPFSFAILTASPGMAEEDPRGSMLKRTYKNDDGETLPYRLFVPKDYDTNKTYPLIVFLHGAGERGNDNEKQLKHAQFLRFAAPQVQAKHPCFIVAPQCPATKIADNGSQHQWVQVPWGAKKPHDTPKKPSDSLRLTMELLDALDKEYSIDPARRYATGLSMGGYGTFDLVVRRPDYFAAAVPICGGADNSRAKDIAHVPMWIFHGDQDSAVPVDRSRSIVAALKAAGASPRYTEYKGQGHFVWGPAYNEPALVDWLFAQKRAKR